MVNKKKLNILFFFWIFFLVVFFCNVMCFVVFVFGCGLNTVKEKDHVCLIKVE